MPGIACNSYNPTLGMLLPWKGPALSGQAFLTNPGTVLWSLVEREDTAKEREGTTALSSSGSWATSHAQTFFFSAGRLAPQG